MYCTGESNLVQGYELEDETIFTLVDDYVLIVDEEEKMYCGSDIR